MFWYQYLSLGCLGICLAACLWHFFRLIRLGRPKDLSRKSGNIPGALVYSYTTAMSPANKESAYLHLPTYIGGIFFHIGTFVGLALFIVFFFAYPFLFPLGLTWALSIILLVSIISGIILFIKRFTVPKVRKLSHPDDYISNLLTTLFQLFTLIYLLLDHSFVVYYYLFASLLLLYIPVGKLRHVVYFFAARYHLGFFYGWRNAWPPKNV